ncbi:hypothetical protein CNYM01_12148 [Colletotrichum nymphaeae SA-01]|uniref:Uncharacterized protein n=1 Tax=Colletotrichum nymphaeae SA-01 TaxID=1460502 RepID=A0A135TR87_9PEZI|nr:hypothetical protein CNYM01_12148 [Colletotrichum nymphaeae SA-01]
MIKARRVPSFEASLIPRAESLSGSWFLLPLMLCLSPQAENILFLVYRPQMVRVGEFNEPAASTSFSNRPQRYQRQATSHYFAHCLSKEAGGTELKITEIITRPPILRLHAASTALAFNCPI